MKITLKITEEGLSDLCKSMEYGNDCFNSSPDRAEILDALSDAYKNETGFHYWEVAYLNGKRMEIE